MMVGRDDSEDSYFKGRMHKNRARLFFFFFFLFIFFIFPDQVWSMGTEVEKRATKVTMV